MDSELIDAYRKISSKYSALKKKPWKDFRIYLESTKKKHLLPSEGILLDVGSGNARNLLLFKDQSWQHIATDISFELLKSSVDLGSNILFTINSDAKSIPLRKNSIDFSLCIATIHHFRNEKEVLYVLKNISEILKEESFLIISCWRKWKKGTRKKMLTDLLLFCFRRKKNKQWRHGDVYLPWYNEEQELIAERFYHLFSKKELKRIIVLTDYEIIDFTKLGGMSGKDNFFLLLKSK